VTAFIYPRSAGSRVVDRLEAACRAGGSTFHGTGIEPGWAAEVLPLTMSALFRRIDSILVQELLDYSSYDSADMLIGIMGFGHPPDAPVPMADPSLAAGPFRAPLMLVADGLCATIDDFVYERQVEVANEGFDITAARIEAGTVSAQRFSCTAIVDGRRAPARRRTGQRAAAGGLSSRVRRRWCWSPRSACMARTRTTRAAWAPRCTPCTPSPRSAPHRRASERSWTFR
jgi:hypothetical protein